jgi:23S rRNA pseudouridine2605 synthase
MEKNRLAKVMAAAGVAARRKCEEIISAGRVTVDGKVCLVPQTLVSLEENEIIVNGKRLGGAEDKVYFLLNKPTGVVCSNTRPHQGQRVIDLFPNDHRLFTVGRLDKDTTGLLIVTNDGQLANRVIHPSSGVEKEYLASVEANLTEDHLELLRRGTRVEGIYVKPLAVEKVGRKKVRIVVAEGKKREVRVMLQRADLEVVALCRTRIGRLRLGNLPVGGWSQVTLGQAEAVFS